jgi:lipopolysaccharide transport system permease protein
MVGVIDGFRWAISAGRAPLYRPGLLLSVLITLFLLLSGIWYFRKMERTFADVI